ncbi:hypothetical protein NM208_g4079 [Fusarium decemcellulare]|uniref:Uncharacterized protein n=2 Tax=Fusarium decemcellulare TaxID=57161 RepID=A0ACC1SLJ4_9HYPO|nr:hypothetical protein NM208_g4306 [Fusarium decemcellulare]KAJ3542476.1 hypothetical protein NM208_g4079 [Fusarium decemcellulare]
MLRIACYTFILQPNTIVSNSDSSSFHYKPSYPAQSLLSIIYHNVRFHVEELREHIMIALDEEQAKRQNGWFSAITTRLNNGTAKEAAEWTAFAIMATAARISFNKIPWSKRSKRRFHIFPFIATLTSAICYLLLALGYTGEHTCKEYHLANTDATDEPDDWQPGSLEGGTNLKTCRQSAGLDRPEWGILLMLWICQFVTQAVGSLSSCSAAYIIMTIRNNDISSDSDEWNLVLKFWPYATVAFFIVQSIYQTITHRNAKAHRFLFSLAAYMCALCGIRTWANRRVFPSNIEYIIYAIIDVLLHPATCLWLLEVDVPNVGIDYDVDVIQHAAPAFNLSQAFLFLRIAQVTIWSHNQGYKS